jgi:hypothetical protein
MGDFSDPLSRINGYLRVCQEVRLYTRGATVCVKDGDFELAAQYLTYAKLYADEAIRILRDKGAGEVKPLAIDLFCGLGGWTEGLIAEGYDVIGFDIERHVYGEHKYPAQLVLQDALTIHGKQFRNVDLIVASPPCEEYSYMAMPWSRAKAIAEDYRSGKRDVAKLNALFDACFRIQREACEAAGRHIPLVVENVRGAQPWVGRSRWNYGSFHLWGDVPALMPMTKALKVPGFRFDGSGKSFQSASVAIKNTGCSWFNIAHNTTSGKGQNPDGRKGIPHRTSGHWTNPAEHVKNGNDWFGAGEDCSLQRRASSGSNARKAASATIAKIPLPLARHIAAVWKPAQRETAAA